MLLTEWASEEDLKRIEAALDGGAAGWEPDRETWGLGSEAVTAQRDMLSLVPDMVDVPVAEPAPAAATVDAAERFELGAMGEQGRSR